MPSKLSRAVAATGAISRRVAFGAVVSGRVSVNGRIVRSPVQPVSPETDVISLDGKVLARASDSAPPRIWRYHKPRGVIVSHADPEQRPSVFESLPDAMPRVISVGRLDIESEGLLLLTTHGHVARTLEHPSSAFVRVYRTLLATGARAVNETMTQELAHGLTLTDGTRFRGCRCSVEGSSTKGKQWVRMELTEGKNREVRRIWSHYGFSTLALVRTAYGPFALDELPPGQLEEVSERSVARALAQVSGSAPCTSPES
jgi:23S rRNA pseudouridine2605 synthase